MSVERDEVELCYRHLPGREPESREVFTEKMSTHRDLWHMIRSFVTSTEVRRKQIGLLPPLRVDVPAARIETEAEPAALEMLVAHVRDSWEMLGHKHAHYSVLTKADYLPENFAGNADAFWKTGEDQVVWLARILARHGMTSTGDLTCLDFGCDVGRLTRPLAHRFATVHGYDISEPHLDVARAHTVDCGNVELHLLREMPLVFAPTDVFFSLIVLQHNPPPIIALLIRSALQCIRPGGLAVFQVPTYHLGYEFSIDRFLGDRGSRALGLEMHCIPQHEVFRIARETGCEVLEVREQDMTGRWGSDVSNVFVIRSPR